MSVETNRVPSTAALAPSDALFITLATNATLTQERVLTGTANQIAITDNGAGGNVVLSLVGPYTPATLTAHGVLLGQGTGSITAVAVPVTTGKFLRSVANTDPVWSTLTIPDTAVQGDILYASAANVMAMLADVAAGSYLRSGGVGAAPLWSTVTLPNSLVQGDNLVATSANTVGVVSAVQSGRALMSQGAGAVPAYTATPTLGLAGSTQGSLALSGITAGAVTLAVPANVTGSYSFTFPAAAPAQGGIAYFSDAAGQVAATAALTAKSLMLSQGTGAPTALGAATDGQLPIGSTGNNPVLAALTAGTGIVITNASGSITVATNITGATASTTTPQAIVDETGVVGVSLTYARSDHVHAEGPRTNNIALRWKDSGATARNILTVTSGDLIQLGASALGNLRVLSANALFQAGGLSSIGTFDNNALAILNNNTESARFFASGGFSLGSTTDPGDNNMLIAGTLEVDDNTSVIKSLNGGLALTVKNVNGGTGAYAQVSCSNDGGNGYMTIGCTGTGFTTGGAYVQDGAWIDAGVNLSGGLSIIAQASPMRFYVGGVAAGNLILSMSTTTLTLSDAINIAVNATTGTKIGTATTQKLGFWNATPVVRDATAFTQTYATAGHTLANNASADLATTAATNLTPFGFTTAAQANDIATQVNLLRADLSNAKAFVNALVDTLQSYGMIG